MVERPLIREEGGEFWSLADEWFDVDPKPTHSPDPLTTDSVNGQQPQRGGPPVMKKTKECIPIQSPTCRSPQGDSPMR